MEKSATCIEPPRPRQVPRLLSEEFGHDRAQLDTLGDGMTVASVGGGDVVVSAQDGAYPRGYGFFTQVGVHETGQFPDLEQLFDPCLEDPDAHHRTVDAQGDIGGHGFRKAHWAVYPPSTATTCPVTMAEASPARNTTGPATSSGSPSRFIGVRDRK